MSELKAETIYLQHESGENYAVEFYEKSEADKVIAQQKYKRCLANTSGSTSKFPTSQTFRITG